MRIIKPLTLGILSRPYSKGGAQRFAVTALGFFALGAARNERFLIENTSWALIAPRLGTRQPLDEACPKARAEVLVAGSAYAPQGKPVQAMQVSLQLGALEKTLNVVGTREWYYGLVPWYQVSAPKPFVTMPLDYSHALGGARHPGNPLGVGYTGNRFAGLFGRNKGVLPNLEAPGQAVRYPWKKLTPAGFGPLALNWQPRSQRFGTYKGDWLKQAAPGLAADASALLFNMAPQDQWLPEFLRGGEPYRLAGMHPDLPEVQGRLPELAARAFVRRSGASADALEEVPMRFDTVWFFPDLMLGVAIYHGEIANTDRLGLDIDTVMVAYEHRDHARELAHYRDVMLKRSDKASGALHMFNESQLCAGYSAVELARRAQRDLDQEQAALAKRQASLDAQMAEFWAHTGMTPPSDYTAPVVQTPPVKFPSAQQLKDSDFDLSATVAQARAYAQKTRDTQGTALDTLPQRLPAAPAPDAVAQQDQVLARAAVVAHDLAPGGAVLPSALQQVIDQACQAGAAITPELNAQLRTALAAQAAQQRHARSAAPKYAGKPLEPGTARWLGAQVQQWHRGGALLAGRDLAGADLSGFDFTGADLREVMLENANLSGACFRQARLDRASLSGACLDGADFSEACLQQANLSHSSARATRFCGAQMQRVQALSASWPQADLSDAQLQRLVAPDLVLSGAVLNRAHLEHALLLGASARASHWQGATLSRTVLLRADLEQADFSGARLDKVVLMEARLMQSIWRNARLSNVAAGSADWRAAVLEQVSAQRSSWHAAVLGEANFSHANLVACDLSFCDLRGAQLTHGLFAQCLLLGSDLRGVQAGSADFFQALLRNGDWRDAQAVGASFVQADTGDAKFDHADLREIVLEAGRSLA
jgi:uncharacterized protein YjbI with pentapeptide repeats